METHKLFHGEKDADTGILLVGCGGHCRSVLDSVLASCKYDNVGVTAKDKAEAALVGKDPVLAPYLVGSDDDLPRLFREGWRFAFVALGSVGSVKGRQAIAEKLRAIGFSIPVIADPTAVLARSVRLEEGVFIGKLAVVNAGAQIGAFAILNTACVVEHDCRIGVYSHVSPGAVLCGQVTVGDRSHVGAGSVVRQSIRIGDDVLIGAGSFVVKDLPDAVTAFGNPCRMVENR